MKKWLKSIIFIALLTAIIAGCAYAIGRKPSVPGLKLGSSVIQVETADTGAERAQGLSGRAVLPDNAGMLFIFDDAGQQCMWMKDMKFSLDMVWLDADKKVIDMRQNLSPDTYPKSFCPSQPARYVIEVNQGVLVRSGIKLGDTVQF